MKRWVMLLMLTLYPASEAAAQAVGQITGLVTDPAGTPLAGVAVTAQGSGRGAVSGADGRFTVTAVPAGTYQLRATLLGFAEATQAVTVAAGQTATANVQMQRQIVELEGLVAIGYGTQRRQDVTGSVVSVRSEDILQIPTPTVTDALKGRVAGLDVFQNNYRPGDNPVVRIRGVRSMRASNEPLFVVDGVPIAGGIGDINPNIVQSIEVLKDASATAIYGSRGANGVVLITTNQGRAGVTQVNYDVSYGTQHIHNMVEVFSGPEFADYKREAFRTSNKYPCPADATGFRATCEAGDIDIFSLQERQGMQNGVNTNWMDLISRTGRQQNHQLNIMGGSETTRFAIGGNFYEEEGVTFGMGFTRRQANISVDHQASRLRAGVSANVSNSVQDLGRGDGIWGEAMRINPLGSPWDADGNLVGTPTPDAQAWNPLLDIQNFERENLRSRAFGNAFAGYELFPGINARTTFGADMIFRREGEFRGALTQVHRGTANDTWVERFQTFSWVSTTQLDLDRVFGAVHRLNGTVLYEIQHQEDDRSRAHVQNVPYEYQRWYNIGTGAAVQGVTSNFQEFALQSVMARANYTLLDRYYLTFTGRQDCSSRLAPGNKCAIFPSAAAKWRISDEGFMFNQGFFNDLSLRASYGRTGNTGIPPYETQGSLTRTVYSFNDQGAFGFRPGAIANPALEWEKTDQYDIGVEFAMIDHRLSGSLDFYVQNTFDLLMNRVLPTTSGYNSVLENIGETRNTGLELTLSTLNVENFRGLRWSSDINFSTNRNEIVSLYGLKEDDVANNWFIGHPIHNSNTASNQVFFEYEFGGIWQLDQAAEAAVYNQIPGQIRVVDQNGDGRIDAADRVIIGNTYPRWYGSLSNRLEFGGFDLAALINARWGYMINSAAHDPNLAGRYNNVKVNYWTPNNPSNSDPRPNSDQEFPIYGNTRRFQDASHWRVRNITLGYQVPFSVIDRVGGQSVRLYAQAQDPFVFTDFKGFDPESGGGLQVPSFKMFTVGASVGF